MGLRKKQSQIDTDLGTIVVHHALTDHGGRRVEAVEIIARPEDPQQDGRVVVDGGRLVLLKSGETELPSGARAPAISLKTLEARTEMRRLLALYNADDAIDMESALDKLVILARRAKGAQIDASACGTRQDFDAMNRAEDAFAEAREAFLRAFGGAK